MKDQNKSRIERGERENQIIVKGKKKMRTHTKKIQALIYLRLIMSITH